MNRELWKWLQVQRRRGDVEFRRFDARRRQQGAQRERECGRAPSTESVKGRVYSHGETTNMRQAFQVRALFSERDSRLGDDWIGDDVAQGMCVFVRNQPGVSPAGVLALQGA
jgi:hypothetical protein